MPYEITVSDLRDTLRKVHASIGHEGHFSFTISEGREPQHFVTHWVKTGFSGYEDCRAVGMGTLEECLAALERYALAYQRQPTPAEIAATLGVTAPAMLAAE